MKNNIYYIGFYNHESIINDNRFNFPAATSKMDYIVSLLNRLKLKAVVINPSWTQNSKCYKGKYQKINDYMYLKTFFTLPWSNKIFKSLSSRLTKLQLFIYLFFKLKKNDKVIVYHSIYYSKLFCILKHLKHFELILEIEEIYQDINELTNKEIINENKIFMNADKYIFSTELMKERIDNKKDYITISGNYLIKHKYNEKFQDKKIHLVYAGIIDTKKQGAFEIFKIAKYFNDKYVFHILGFGSKQDLDKLNVMIEKFNKENKTKIEYNGLLNNEELNKFLQKCDIGLSCQTPVGKYNNSSFPSKIINYLTNGLNVITIDIPVIRKSKIGNIVLYYTKNKYEEVYNKVKEINKTNNDIFKSLIEIDESNLKDLKSLIGVKNETIN